MRTKIIIEGIVAGLNGNKGLIREHYHAAKKVKTKYLLLIMSQTNNRHKGAVKVTYTGYKNRLMDWDNFSASFKHLGDMLTEAKVKHMVELGQFVELKRLDKRSLRQNNYLHLILSALAMETGYSLEVVKKNFFKLECNEDLFLIISSGALGPQAELRSTADLSTEELSLAIDRFRMFAEQQGYYLPLPNEEDILKSIALQASRLKRLDNKATPEKINVFN